MGNKIERPIKALAHMALRKKENAFIQNFAEVSDEELLNYLISCVDKLGIAPSSTDILGAGALGRRFGDWHKVLEQIGLEPTPKAVRKNILGLFELELQNQEEMQKEIADIIAENEKIFAVEHKDDTDEELIAYVSVMAAKIGHVPGYIEVPGGKYIKKRFDNSWREVLRLAGMKKKPDSNARLDNRFIYMQEWKRLEAMQVEECMQEVAASFKIAYSDEQLAEIVERVKTAEDVNQQAADEGNSFEAQAKRLAVEVLAFKEERFAGEYGSANEALLLEYVKECACELGHFPHKSEIVGGECLERRFGSWEALRLAVGQAEVDEADIVEPALPDRLIYRREVKIQELLLRGREHLIYTLYKSPLVADMQTGNIYQVLRYSPQAYSGAAKRAPKLIKEMLKDAGHKGRIAPEVIEAKLEPMMIVYDRTLEALDLRTRKFAVKHRNDSDAELLEYLRKCMQRMCRVPQITDIMGGEFIRRRFNCSWSKVIEKIGKDPTRDKRPVFRCRIFKDEFNRQMELYKQETAAKEAV